MHSMRLPDARLRSAAVSRRAAFTSRPVRVCSVANGNGNGASHSTAAAPTSAESARTIVDISSEGVLSTVAADGSPIGTPVSFALDKEGHPCINLLSGGMELDNLARDARCSLHVRPTSGPARAVASVTLLGKWDWERAEQQQGACTMAVDKCMYFGGYEQAQGPVEVSGEDFRSAEPDVLRTAAHELIRCWNDERAEDIYRIVSDHLRIPLSEMSYAELLWLDRLGMYVRVEAAGSPGPAIVRVPFYRAVLDERDARSVLTMAAQVAWERDRPYTPPVPSVFTDAAAAANN